MSETMKVVIHALWMGLEQFNYFSYNSYINLAEDNEICRHITYDKFAALESIRWDSHSKALSSLVINLLSAALRHKVKGI